MCQSKWKGAYWVEIFCVESVTCLSITFLFNNEDDIGVNQTENYLQV